MSEVEFTKFESIDDAEITYPEDEDNGDEEFRRHFVIENDQTADWALSMIKSAEAEKARWKAFYDERYRRVCEDADRTIENMKCVLETYFAKVPHRKTGTQESYQLPSGKLVFKKQAPEYERDDEILINWIYQNAPVPGEFIHTKETVNWSELKKTLKVNGDQMVTEDGEIVPGIKVVERPDAFKVELKKEKENG